MTSTPVGCSSTGCSPLECTDSDPLQRPLAGKKGKLSPRSIPSPLDATTFCHQGKRWYLWAQKDPQIAGNTNLYLAELENPWTLKGAPIMLSKPEFARECRGFMVNEGPAVLVHGDKLFISYSASATDENYCMGLLWIDIQADPLQPANWHKSPQPVFRTSYEKPPVWSRPQ